MRVDTRGLHGRWLGHPATVIALLVLVVNDHVLKAAYPGWVTGKLSDAAGLVLAPPLLAAVLGLRGRRIALIAAVLFRRRRVQPARYDATTLTDL